MANNISVTPGSGADVATDQLASGVHVQYFKLMDGTEDGTSVAVVGTDGLHVEDAQARAAIVNVVTSVSTVNTSVGQVKSSVDGVSTNIANVKTSVDSIANAIDQLERYKLCDLDDGSTPAYYGYADISGNWYIRKVTEAAVRYVSGTSGYSAAWTNRATQTYDYYFNVF